VIDSWAKIPSGIFGGKSAWLGAYDQCITIPNAKYCTVGMSVFGTVCFDFTIKCIAYLI